MKWYGEKAIFTNKRNLKNLKYKLNLKTKSLNFSMQLSVNFKHHSVYFLIPAQCKFILCENYMQNVLMRYLYVYSAIYYFYYSLPPTLLSICSQNSTCITLIFLYKNIFYNNYEVLFKNIFYIFFKLFFKKLKFKGKGFYIFKNSRNTIAPQFGYSHQVRRYIFFTSVRFLSKTSIIIYGINKFDILQTTRALHKIKPINIFTSKGIRFTRQILYKKTGKVSSYR